MSNYQVLIYGFGNPGRQDDGLGPALIQKLEDESLKCVMLDSDYQLNIENAAEIAKSQVVIFVDASESDDSEPFSFNKVKPAHEITFTTHTLSPESLLALTNELYNKHVDAYVLAMKGYSWEFEEGLTVKAEENLNAAFSFIKEKTLEILQSLGCNKTAAKH